MMNRLTIFVLLMFSFLVGAKAQTATELEQWGDDAYKTGNYQSAWTFFNEAARLDSTSLSLWYKMGESAREYYNYNNAFQCFRIVYEKDMGVQFPLALFWMAELSRNTGDYLMARAYYSLFLEQPDGEGFFCDKAREQLQHFDIIEQLVADTSEKASIEHIPLPVNTPFSEFGGVQLSDDRIYFTSVQPMLSDDGTGILGNSFLSSVYYSDFTTRGLSRPVKIEEPINSKSEHTANICFNEDGSEIWFNRCEMTGEYKYRCDIYNSKLENNRWSKPEKIPVNVAGFTSTQPYFCIDTSGLGLLYFASDRPGGMGQLDIWYSVLKDGKYNAPVNAGSIVNTQGNEITPYYDTSEAKLYFSSDWYYGLGGYDIFFAPGALSSWEPPQNAGKPFNSSANDFFFNINTVDRDGYFTSNREGSYFFKGETCCNDLYAFYRNPDIHIDTIPDDTLVVENMLKRSIDNLLPLDLYFHNDIPDPRSRDSVTTSNYDETYYAYTGMIDRYKKEYSKGLSTTEAEKARDEIEIFFLAYVTAGFQDLLELTPLMTADLEAGSRVTIKIQGFTSPLTSTEYNISLAKRRIGSVINYLSKIDGGRLAPYIDGTAANGGRLVVNAEPIGEALSDPFVSDNPNDARNSVYSIAAARERRIQIVSYESDFAGQVSRQLQGPLLVMSANDVKISLASETQACTTITITNTGDETLEITSLHSDQPWMIASLKNQSLVPGNVTTLEICIDRALLKNPALGILVIESNSRDKRSVVYVRVVH
ncbi:MAG: hypothetical protein CVU11_13895 [Bacteroidetes bacterium HGW-Bacteroidetes-6]|jgi:tetratricopeptide (TPR) repeat protein|nr:MAG: hypothetical protein CVU11_13895 [Bacteroidetes bacterium HGW-Bacteroidetes-6]